MYNSPFEVSPQYNFQPPYWSSAIQWDSLLWPLGSSLESGGPSSVISQWQMEGICFSLVFTYCVEFSVGWYGAGPHRSSRPSLVLRMSSQRMALLGESYAVTMISGNWKSNWAIPLDDFPVHHFRGLSFGGRELVVAVNGSGISHSLANMGDYLLVRCIYSRYRIGCFLQGSISLQQRRAKLECWLRSVIQQPRADWIGLLRFLVSIEWDLSKSFMFRNMFVTKQCRWSTNDWCMPSCNHCLRRRLPSDWSANDRPSCTTYSVYRWWAAKKCSLEHWCVYNVREECTI